MKLHRLELVNYRRHRRSAIEFPDGVTALLGRNGSGKTTVLEALGFALFGPQATRTSKDLLRHDGAPDGDPVRVTAELELGGQAVRVVRELRGRALTPTASLEVDGIVLVAPTAGSADAVTAQVERRLGMRRDGFFTTVVARQKELGLLADQAPRDRKRLILEMLGVDQVDRAIQRARDRRREAEGRVEALREFLGDPEALASAVRTAEAEVAAASRTEADAQERWREAREALAARDEALATARRAHEARRETERRADAADAALRAARERATSAVARLEAAESARRRAEAMQEAAARLPDAERTLREAREHAAAAARRAEALRVVAAEGDEVLRIERALAALPATVEPDPETAKRLEEARGAAADAQRRVDLLGARQQELRARRRRLASLGEEAPCPTCERPLSDHLPRIRAETEKAHDRLQGETAAAKETLEQAAAVLAQAKRDAEAAGQAARDHARVAAERRSMEEALAVARRRRREAEAKVPDDPGPAPELAPLETEVAEARRAHDERVRAEALGEGLPGAREEADAAALAVQAAEAALAEAREALAALPDTTRALKEAEEARRASALAEREAERSVHAAHLRASSACRGREEAVRRRGEDRDRRRRLKTLEEDARYWAALAGPRGGGLLDGFKDHLIHRVGPAIAHEASRLLDRFTGGRYTELVLDDGYEVYVTDGGRRYAIDRFSGGEADLVHLALRLAVSRLLAERSGGAEVRFLALDEVFGSLDAERQDLVVAALQELGSLYSQVLLVTHLDSLQEALDQAILVEERDGEAVVSVHTG